MPTFKDIEALLPASVVTGNEKLPISAYLYLTVQQVAQMAVSQITQVTDSLSTRVENIESAGVISPAEKPYISLLIDEIEAKYLYISQRAADKGVSIADLTIAYNNVVPYLSSFVEDMTSPSAVNRDVMNSLVVAFTTQYLKADEACNSVQGLKEALDGKLPLSGGTLTGNITAPSFKTNLTSGVAEAVMAYPVNISWGNDLNSDTYLKAGMYRTSSATSTVNQPNEKGHSNLLTIRGNESDNIAQMFFDYWNNGKVFTRVGSITVDTTSTSHIFNRDWKQLRTMNDLVTTSHIATAAITPAKIQTSIALNGTPSMTVEPTTSSPDKTIASVGLAKQVVEDIEIGGRNLILNSDFSKGVSYWNPAYDASTVLFSVENNIATFTLGVSDATVLQTSAILFEVGQEYTVSFDCRSDEYTALDYCYFIGQEGQGNKSFYIYGITSEWKRIIYTFTSEISGLYRFGFGTNRNRNTAGSFQLRNVKIEKGNKATDWTPAPEDINTEISNAESRSKSYAEDYTDAEITKIENGETVAQKANSLYDEDSGDWKIWKDVTNAVGDEVEEVLKQNNFATKDDIQSIIPSNATETGAGIVRAATQAEVNDGHVSDNDPSEMAFVRPETLENYIDSKGFATTSDISDALASAKPDIFFQVAQPAGGKDGDIWIIP